MQVSVTKLSFIAALSSNDSTILSYDHDYNTLSLTETYLDGQNCNVM